MVFISSYLLTPRKNKNQAPKYLENNEKLDIMRKNR